MTGAQASPTPAFPALALCGSNLGGDVPFSCALALPGGITTAQSPAGARGDLAGLADGLCRAAGVRPMDLRELRLDLGPGSYTGLRVAVTFVRFLQQFGATPALATDSLLLLADSTAPTANGRRLRPLLDARRDRFHVGTLQHTGGTLQHLAPPVAVPLETALAGLAAGDLVITTADLATRLGAAIAAAGASVTTFRTPTAEALFAPGLPLRACQPAELEPRYLMGSYAEG